MSQWMPEGSTADKLYTSDDNADRKKIQILAMACHHMFDDRLCHVLFCPEELFLCHPAVE